MWRSSATMALLVLALAESRGMPSIVLLDEYWAPEIVLNDVAVTEVDTLDTGDPSQARTGECSVLLANESGAPNVRFRGAGMVKLDELPLGDTEARLWYRTDAWTGIWRLEVWIYEAATDPIPVKVLQARLDGGGPGGQLQPDDQWHQARGLVEAAEAYERAPKDMALTTYVWLAPEEGWDVGHRTYVDRVELMVPQPPPPPAKRVRPRPGAQTDGPGWVWFEGEDAAQHRVPPGGAWGPQTEAEQQLYSNSQWLQYHGGGDLGLLWEVNVPETGVYDFWCRANGTSFSWAWDANPFQTCTPESPWEDTVILRQFAAGEVTVQWVWLGQVELAVGTHLLQVQDVPETEGFGFDCWLLTRQPFTPHGPDKPSAQ